MPLAEKTIRARLFDVVSAAGYQMEQLLCLLDVVLTDQVPTAAVECSRAPRLLINPDFVDAYCERDGHLLMLVMHELHHVILGHTRLFPRPTPAHNVAFDAVINAMLCRQFPDEADFFRSINSWEGFPARLLRPAPGWPEAPEPLPPSATRAERRLHESLYGDRASQTTYHEIFELLCRTVAAGAEGGLGERDLGEGRSILGDPGDAWTNPGGGPVLLGDHDGAGGAGELDDAACRDDVLRGVLRKVVEGWPPPERRLTGRDQGREEDLWSVKAAPSADRLLRRAFVRLLKRAGVYAGRGSGRRRRARSSAPRDVLTAVPQARDRHAEAWRRMHGSRPLLWRGTRDEERHLRVPRPVPHVYLDVSGSMTAALPALAGALRRPHLKGDLKLFVFSTVIDEAGPQDLLRQRFRNTGGTDIRCVLEHLQQMSRRVRPRHVVLVTDGYVGPVDHRAWEQLRLTVGVGLYASYGADSQNDLKQLARHIEVLPGLPGGVS